MQGINPWLQASLTSGTLSATGDLLAQVLEKRHMKQNVGVDKPFEAVRCARMLTFGLIFYGPFQHWWYNALGTAFPGRGFQSFVCKVVLNQVVLGPLVLTSAFAWNLALKNEAAQLQQKVEKDLFPTLVNGWKFWVPAACINFYVIPVKLQVLYMSICGVVWTAYISFASYNSANAVVISDNVRAKRP